MAEDSGELERALRERDLYRRLLDLGAQTAMEPFLEQALALVVEVTGARQGYLELADEPASWSISSGFSESELADVRSHISRGIIAEAIASGEVVETPSALRDARFSGRASVQGRRIEAVLCAPIGVDPPRGVLYLQGRERSGAFASEDRECALTVARHLAPLVDGLLLRHHSRERLDPTRPLRDQLSLRGLVGRSDALAAMLREVALVAPLDVSVLLTGESGTGKSLVARVIHDNGPRSSHPFVELNCAAIQDTLLESELFGALPGSHSTATRPIQGKVAAADRGTLFLDEVAELSPPAQAKLLQLLQAKIYYPLGAHEPSRADVRILAATNADLDGEVAAGRFREDLFYRLQVLPLRVPSLAERAGDVAELAVHFCTEACTRHGLPRLELSLGARRALESAEWPGNVRQLAHAVEVAAIRAAGDGASRVERGHVFPGEEGGDPADETVGFQEATRRFQKRLLESALEENDWNVVATAKRLDLSRSHFYNLVNAFSLKRKPRE